MRAIFVTLLMFLCMTGVALAAEDHGGGAMKDFFWRMINFAIFAGVLYFLCRRAVRQYFAGRRETIETTLNEAERLRNEAVERLREYDAKLEKASEEIKEMVEMIRSQGEDEKEQIIRDAHATAAKMKADAETRIDYEFKKAMAELKEEAARLSVETAEEILREKTTEKDHENMVNEFLNRMVTRN